MYIYCINLFMHLFIIPSQSIIGKILQNLLAKALRKSFIFEVDSKINLKVSLEKLK